MRGGALFRGVDHVGVGVGDMGAALDFFGRRLGFSEVLFDHTADLPGLEELTHRRRTRARVAMLGSRCATPLGPGPGQTGPGPRRGRHARGAGWSRLG